MSDNLVTSRANPRFKSIRAMLSSSGVKRTHTLLLGSKLVEAWCAVSDTEAGQRLRPTLWLRLEGAKAHPLVRTLGVETLELGESLMRDLSDAGSPPEHALLAELASETTSPLAKRVIVPWGIQDPGNLGAVLRSAAAFGFQEALLGPGCADPFSPKTLRGTMGAAFHLTIRRAETLVPDEGHWYALEGNHPEALSLEAADLSTPLRLLVGNEGHGWQGITLPEAVRFLSIPIQHIESLNAAVAAGIACHEAMRRHPG